MTKKRVEKIKCPDCTAMIAIDLSVINVGDIVECKECGCEAEVIKLNPVQIKEIIEEK